MPAKKSKSPSRKAKAPATSVRGGRPPEPVKKVQQTIYLRPELRKRLRLRAVEEDCDLSTIIEHALEAYLDG